MTGEEVAVALEGHKKEIKSLKSRMDKQEKRDEVLMELTASVKSLAVNMEYMAKEQQDQGERLERLEREPSENNRFTKQAIITCLVSTLGGGIIGALLERIFS